MALLRDFVNSGDADQGKEFMAEDVRNWAHAMGLPQPHSARAWGAVISKAAKDGAIVFAGYGKTANPNAHRTPAAVWRKG